MEKRKSAVRKAAFAVISVLLVLSSAVCSALHIAGSGSLLSINTIAAETTLSSSFGKPRYVNTGNKTETSSVSLQREESREVIPEISEISQDNSIAAETQKTRKFTAGSISSRELEEYDKAHEGEEKYPVVEYSITKGDISYKGIQVKNSSSFDLDIKTELERNCDVKLEKTDKPQVLIYHTHTCESFLDYDTGYYYESFYARSENKKKNVCAVGDEITQQLNSLGIKTLHDTSLHDSPGYSGAYYRSSDTVKEYLKKYPTIKVVLDIHRDGIGTDTQRNKPVCTVNGRKAAQIMILAGYNCDGDKSFDHWKSNLNFALRLQEEAQKSYPGLMRPLYFGDFVYNMDINNGSLLIEIGADSNTVDEARYSGYLLGNVIAKVLSGKNYE